MISSEPRRMPPGGPRSAHGRRQVLVATAVAALAAACGGEDEGRPTEKPEPPAVEDPGSGEFECPRLRRGAYIFTDWLGNETELEFESIEDFEFGAAAGWYTNNPVCTECQEDIGAVCAGGPGDGSPIVDCTDPEDPLQPQLDACWERCADFQEPSFFAKPLPAEEIPDGGRCESRFALHLQAGPFDEVWFEVNEGWGGVIGRQWSVDATEWDGVSFWGRVGPQSRTSIRLQLTDEHTDQDWVEAHPEPNGEPRCIGTVSRDLPEVGCDKWGAAATMNGTWQFFALPFDEMRQDGWGRPEDYLMVWSLKSISIFYDTGLWDFWIDDIAFYRRRSQ